MLISYHCYIWDFHRRLFEEKLLWISKFLKLERLGPALSAGSSEKGRGSPKAKSESEAGLVSLPNCSPRHGLRSSAPVSADQREVRAEEREVGQSRKRGRCWGPEGSGRAHAPAAGDKNRVVHRQLPSTISSRRLLSDGGKLSHICNTVPPIHTTSLKISTIVLRAVGPTRYLKYPVEKGPPLRWEGRDLIRLAPQAGRYNTGCVCDGCAGAGDHQLHSADPPTRPTRSGPSPGARHTAPKALQPGSGLIPMTR